MHCSWSTWSWDIILASCLADEGLSFGFRKPRLHASTRASRVQYSQYMPRRPRTHSLTHLWTSCPFSDVTSHTAWMSHVGGRAGDLWRTHRIPG